MNMFARFDENPAMTLQVIKKTKRYGRTDGRTHGRTHTRTDNVKTVYPTTNKVCGKVWWGGIKIVLKVSMIRKYHNHKLQTTHGTVRKNHTNKHETPGRQTKQSYQLSLPHQDDCKTRMDTKSILQQNIEQ